MKVKISFLGKENIELYQVVIQVNEESVKNGLHLDFIEKNQKANNLVFSGVKENDAEKTTEVALEILKKVDLIFSKMFPIYPFSNIFNKNIFQFIKINHTELIFDK